MSTRTARNRCLAVAFARRGSIAEPQLPRLPRQLLRPPSPRRQSSPDCQHGLPALLAVDDGAGAVGLSDRIQAGACLFSPQSWQRPHVTRPQERLPPNLVAEVGDQLGLRAVRGAGQSRPLLARPSDRHECEVAAHRGERSCRLSSKDP